MWRAHFYEESWIGRRVYVPLVAVGCVVYLFAVGYEHAAAGQLHQPYLAIMLPGFVLFLIAKTSVLRRGIWVSFGTEHMSAAATSLYLIGYALMVVGFVFGFG